MQLMYSNKDELITRDQLRMIPTPAPTGRFHAPMPFGEYVDYIADSIENMGITISNEEFAVTKEHSRFFGILELEDSQSGWHINIGVRGAHDQSISRGMTLGTRIIVCSNLCFHGELGTFSTKQTLNANARIPGLIRDAIDQLPEKIELQESRFNAYRDFELSSRQGDAALVEIHRRGGLSGSQLGKAIAQWDKPAHIEHTENGFSAWRLLNACTESVKPTGNNVNMDIVRTRTMVTSNFINECVGL